MVPIVDNQPLTTAVIGNSADVMARIVDFYIPEGVVLDMTHNTGAFWRKANLEKLDILGVDINPKYQPHVVADNTCLPFRSESFDACVLDPPFGTGSTSPQTIGTADVYNLQPIKTYGDKLAPYYQGILEAKRVVKPKGILVIKCQDEINSGKYQPNHYIIRNYAESWGFRAIMTFILVRPHRPIMRHNYQKNPRSNHSYFLVFRK